MRSLLLLFCILFAPSVSLAQPAIAFDSETKRFGEVTAGETIEHVFEFKNTGDEELIIEQVIPS